MLGMAEQNTATDKAIELLTRAINRRKAALERLKKGEKPGTIDERRLRKLLKQAQRRKRKLLLDRARKAAKLAGETEQESEAKSEPEKKK